MKRYRLRHAKLPNAEMLLPYLQQIDKNQYYSNNGPLLKTLEKKLSAHFNVQRDELACTANGTGSLILSLLASNPTPDSYCILPSFTFIGSAAAIIAAGLKPWFVDVDLKTWALSPDYVHSILKNAPTPIGAVMPVSPFGQKINVNAWLEFKKITSIPVILDAAWCFDNASINELPCMISMHATKVFGTAEGGLVITKNKAIIEHIKQGSNFGMSTDRLSRMPTANFKMSEYHAAIGLAELQQWSKIRADSIRVAQAYINAFRDCPGITLMSGYDGTWATATMNICFDQPIAEQIAKSLNEQNIEARCCWATPCHQHPAYQAYPVTPTPNAERLSHSVLNLPFLLDMTEEDIMHIRNCTLQSMTQIFKTEGYCL